MFCLTKSPAFQFYPDWFLSDTSICLMDPATAGGFMFLMCHAWQKHDCALPDDDEVLAALSRMGTSWEKSKRLIRAAVIEKDGKLYFPNLIEERRKQKEWREKSVQAGKASAKRRNEVVGKWLESGSTTSQPEQDEVVGKCYEPLTNSLSLSLVSNKTTSNICASDDALQCETTLLPTFTLDAAKPTNGSDPNRRRKRTKQDPVMTAFQQQAFAAIWAAYWTRKSKRAAMWAWVDRVKDGDQEGVDRILAAIETQRPGIEAAAKQGRTPIYFSSWLNGGRDEDEPGEEAAINGPKRFLTRDEIYLEGAERRRKEREEMEAAWQQ